MDKIDKIDCWLCKRDNFGKDCILYEDNTFLIARYKEGMFNNIVVLKEHRSKFSYKEKRWIYKYISENFGSVILSWRPSEHAHCLIAHYKTISR